ncbi:bifunctional glutamate N-acetyltransferase/amino-acid acetyltransferase ArgJ [Granulosicoccaceae sp. 1_MG-2023]|nr:bifunctional glutamate N-acetyltransferase/amino-acid acetyltransferase ArgJ [Granulosicoccaceae sp. 1_MG-2023]
MPVNLHVPELIHPVEGVQLASAAAGIRKAGGDDMVMISLCEGSTTAGVFTRNAFCAAPVIVAREHLRAGSARVLLINAGNANAGTGEQGMENARQSCQAVAEAFALEAQQVLPFSTGVISQQLPMDKIHAGIEALPGKLDDAAWLTAAKGIMTTDTLPKLASVKARIGDRDITVTGMAKGAGMIRPDMATMLAFIATDAPVDRAALDVCVREAADQSFNCISIDGDTSTNDACMLCATGKAGGEPFNEQHPHWQAFCDLITGVFRDLAQAIVRDGEGATKFITLDISGGQSIDECREVAYTIAHSPLVKTAFFASDANIGRLLAAIGRSPVADLDISKVDLSLGDVAIVTRGEPDADYSEERGSAAMAPDEITVHVNLRRGEAQATVWTCDLSHDYVTINAEYRT